MTYRFKFENEEFIINAVSATKAMVAANHHFPLGGGYWQECSDKLSYVWIAGNFFD